MTKKFNLCIILITALCLGLVAVVFIFTTKDKSSSVAYDIKYSPDYAVSGNVSGLVANSDYVVAGHYKKFIENWDMGEKHLSEVYSFVVDTSLLGNVKGQINVAMPHTVLLKHTVGDEEYEATLNLPNYSKPDFDKTYVLFLKKAQTKDVYVPSSVPFQVEVDSTGKVALKTNKDNKSLTLKTKKNDTIHFQSEQIELTDIDKISGLTEDALFEEIKVQVAVKEKNK